MSQLSSFHAKICFVATGALVHQGKILLVLHKKLGFWLFPGGHLEPNELPHQAAEREFWEETGIKVKVYGQTFPHVSKESEYLPLPFASNLHWISQENYQARLAAKDDQKTKDNKWQRGCEQHLVEIFLVELLDKESQPKIQRNLEELIDINWFSSEEIDLLQTTEDIKQEIKMAFLLSKQNT